MFKSDWICTIFTDLVAESLLDEVVLKVVRTVCGGQRMQETEAKDQPVKCMRSMPRIHILN